MFRPVTAKGPRGALGVLHHGRPAGVFFRGGVKVQAALHAHVVWKGVLAVFLEGLHDALRMLPFCGSRLIPLLCWNLTCGCVLLAGCAERFTAAFEHGMYIQHPPVPCFIFSMSRFRRFSNSLEKLFFFRCKSRTSWSCFSHLLHGLAHQLPPVYSISCPRLQPTAPVAVCQ